MRRTASRRRVRTVAVGVALAVAAGGGIAGSPVAAGTAGAAGAASSPAAAAPAAGTAAAPAAAWGAEPVTPADRALARDSLRGPLTRERFYFVMADRFANGTTRNDRGGLSGARGVTGFDPTDKGFYHGGDIAGMTARLDYIQRLGTTAIWLTPSFKNRPVQGIPPNDSAGYHGYWITDFTQVDPHFGTNAELKDFVAKAHARGMKVFFDIITNHTADVIDYAQKQYSYVDKATAPYRDASGRVFDDRAYAGTNRFPPLSVTRSFPYTPVFRSPADATVKVPAWLNDRRLYHNRGDSTFQGESSEYGDFFGLDDLFTEHPAVVKGMTDVYRAWVDFGIDGFRIDTVKHVNLQFWQRWAPAIEARARQNGNRDFFMFGEVYDSDPAFLSRYTTAGKLPATLDFGFQSAARAFSAGRGTDELRDFFARDDYYTDADSNAYALPTFLGNHDMGRIGYFLRGDNPDASPRELLRRDRMAHSLMYLTRGQPVVYYGDEQGFVGDGGDRDARQDMFASKVASYNDDPLLIGSTATGSRDRYDARHPMYRHLRRLSRLVEEHPALRDGAQVQRYAAARAGVFAVSRVDARRQVEYVVAVNNATTPQTVTLPTYTPRMGFRGLWPAGTDGVRADAAGRVTVTVPALSAAVWQARRPMARPAGAPALRFSAPTSGGTLGGRAPVRVEVADDRFAQVTFAVRKAGTSRWVPLGTDDNPPYRVFPDLYAAVPGLAKGDELQLRAVVKDARGALAAASTTAVAGDPAP